MLLLPLLLVWISPTILPKRLQTLLFFVAPSPSAAMLVLHATGSLAKPMAAPSAAPTAIATPAIQPRSAGDEINGQKRALIELHVLSAGAVSRSRGKRRGKTVSRISSGHASSTEKGACEDFPLWRDAEDENCTKYAEVGWALSCVGGGSGVAIADRYDARQSKSALRLSALAACCACGGGQRVGRKVAVAHLSELLWTMIKAINDQDVATQPQTSPPDAVSILFIAGREALEQSLFSLSNEQLREMGSLLAEISSQTILAGLRSLPWDIAQLIGNLSTTLSVVDARLAAQISEDTGIPAVATPVDQEILHKNTEDVSQRQLAQAISDVLLPADATVLQWRALLASLLQCLAVVAILWGIMTLFSFHFATGPIFVMLNIERDYVWDVNNKVDFGIGKLFGPSTAHLLGFYLPTPVSCPDRLREFALALLGHEPHAIQETSW